MDSRSINLDAPVLWIGSRLFKANFRTLEKCRHRFGGKLSLFVDTEVDRVVLHRLMTLDLSDPVLQAPTEFMRVLPLFYGFRHDGCRMRYNLVSESEIKLIDIQSETPSEDWPYSNYPSAFPVSSFDWCEVPSATFEMLNDACWQGFEESDADKLLIVVPPNSSAYGLPLWGETGSEPCVNVVFCVEALNMAVRAWNESD